MNIEELKELEAKATPRPWTKSNLMAMSRYSFFISEYLLNHDANLILAIRNALLELIKEISHAQKAEAMNKWFANFLTKHWHGDYLTDEEWLIKAAQESTN